MKFDISNRFSGAVQFTAEIDASEDDTRELKVGLAVKWAVKNRASLDWASLDGANLNRASLYRANLNGANLYRASLDGASLDWASLDWANLNRANLNGASLNGASLDGANLNGANLYRANGVTKYVKCIQIEQYPIAYTDTTLQIGCERHRISEWADFDNSRIAKMDGKKALKFWAKYKDWIFQAIELCPAKPTGYTEASE